MEKLMRKLNMLLAAALLGGGAALVPAESAFAHSPVTEAAGAVIQAQYRDPYARGRLFVQPAEVEVGERVTLSARGLRPGMRLRLLAGRNPARLALIRTVRADAAGRLYLRVRAPEWARPGRNLFFALETEGGRIVAQSRPVRVVESDRGDADERITVTGELLAPSATCPRLAGDDGRVYALAGSLRQFDTGDRVRVTGELADVSICNQRRTIEVERIRSVE
jgi:hypothetical protein